MAPPATGSVSPGTLDAGYVPAGSLARDARRAHGGAAAGLRLGGAIHGRGQGHGRALLAQFPFVPLAVLLELVAWVLVAGALIGRPWRVPSTAATATTVFATQPVSETLAS